MKPYQILLLVIVACSSFIIVKTKEDHKEKTAFKYNAHLKREVIRLYPNPSFDGTISVSTMVSDTLHFYIFDLEGTLINQTILTNKEKKTIKDLKTGSYIYDVFSNDESIEEGKIIVK